MLFSVLRLSARHLRTLSPVHTVSQRYYSAHMAKRVAVVLAGCGVYDGSEIHEASAVLVHLSRGGATVSVCVCWADRVFVRACVTPSGCSSERSDPAEQLKLDPVDPTATVEPNMNHTTNTHIIVCSTSFRDTKHHQTLVKYTHIVHDCKGSLVFKGSVCRI